MLPAMCNVCHHSITSELGDLTVYRLHEQERSNGFDARAAPRRWDTGGEYIYPRCSACSTRAQTDKFNFCLYREVC